MDLREYTKYLTHVLACAVTGTVPEDIPDGMDEGVFLELCKFHKLENIVYLTVGDKLSESARKTLEEKYNRLLFIQATQQYYLETIECEFEKAKIPYLILKGRELAKLYPREDMRQSSDFDIYIGRKNSQKARDIMTDIGFDILAYNDNDDDHDEYIADNCVICELHRVLIQDDHPWQTECNKMPERMILCEGTECCYKLSIEDFYAYNLAHAAKHMKLSGVGIRVFLDQWLILNKYKTEIDLQKLNNILEKCNLAEFNKNAVALCEYWFERKLPEDIEKIEEMADYVARSGWVGTAEQMSATELAENAGVTSSRSVAKLKICWDIIASPYESMVERYPFLREYKWLTFFCRIHRAFNAIFHKRNLVKTVTSGIDNGDMNLGKKIVKFKKNIGL